MTHPEVGKYLIAIGEWVFGLNPFGYRVASAVFGSLAILLMCRIARRLTRSTLLGCIAGLLLSLDGMEFVLSRTGILDIFLMCFVLAAFGAMLIDRDVSRSRLAQAVVLRPGDEAGPELASGSGGYWPACLSAWPVPSSRTLSGTSPRSSACRSRGT